MILLSVSPELRPLLSGLTSPTMLTKLQSELSNTTFPARYHTLRSAISLCQNAGEANTDYISCARAAWLQARNARPAGYTLEMLDEEMLMSTLLLGSSHASTTTTLLAQSSLSLKNIEDALQNIQSKGGGSSGCSSS